MRIAIVSDIHGNRTAFEAVLADLRETAPDAVFHGGDLADGGSSPAEIVDRVRDEGWPGVLGNTDEMLFRPESLAAFATQSPHLRALFDAVGEMANYTRAKLGEDRLAWLAGLPRTQIHEVFALVHASNSSTWRSPAQIATDEELFATYSPLARPVVVYGHIHWPYIRYLPGLKVANSGSAGLPYDGDARASYLVLDDGRPSIRRVAYDVEREQRALASSGLPHFEWPSRMLSSARPEMP